MAKKTFSAGWDICFSMRRGPVAEIKKKPSTKAGLKHFVANKCGGYAVCGIKSQQEVQMMTCLWLCMPVYFVWSQAFCLGFVGAYWKWYNLHFIHLIAFVGEKFRFEWKEIWKILRFIILRHTHASRHQLRAPELARMVWVRNPLSISFSIPHTKWCENYSLKAMKSNLWTTTEKGETK